MARESQLWKWLSGARLAFRARLHICRVENPAHPGTPDVEGQLQDHGQFWFELKSGARPANPDGIVRLPTRPKQCDWLRKRWSVGGCAYMLIQVGHGHDRAIYLIAGQMAHAVHAGVTERWMKRNAVHVVARGQRKGHSALILAALRRPVSVRPKARTDQEDEL